MGHGFHSKLFNDPRVGTTFPLPALSDRGVHQESHWRSGADGCRLEIGRATGDELAGHKKWKAKEVG
jgi:hypothetical protein